MASSSNAIAFDTGREIVDLYVSDPNREVVPSSCVPRPWLLSRGDRFKPTPIGDSQPKGTLFPAAEQPSILSCLILSPGIPPDQLKRVATASEHMQQPVLTARLYTNLSTHYTLQGMGHRFQVSEQQSWTSPVSPSPRSKQPSSALKFASSVHPSKPRPTGMGAIEYKRPRVTTDVQAT